MAADTMSKKFSVGGVPNTAKAEGTHLSADPSGETDRITYASGRSAVVRSVSDPADFVVFLGHTTNVTTARFSPDGKLIASADEAGMVRVWDPKTGIQKVEFQASGSPIRDLAFSQDMKFMIIGGEARGSYAKVVKYPTGGSAGTCGGHTKRVLAVDVRMKPSKQIIVASEDFRVSLHKGPPVGEYATPVVLNYHSNFVNDIRYSPDATRFATCSTDRTVCILDAESHQTLFTMEGHEASVLQLCWFKDGKQLVTCSSDKTMRVWDATAGTQGAVIKVGDDANDVPSSVVCIPKTEQIVALALDGRLLVYDKGSDKPAITLRGHARVPVGIALLGDRLISADYTGMIVSWQVHANRMEPSEVPFKGRGPTTLAAIGANNKIVATIGSDGHVYLVPLESMTYGEPFTIKGGGKDITVAAGGDGDVCCVVLNEMRMTALGYDGSVKAELDFEPGGRAICVAISPDASMLAYSYEVQGGAGVLQFAKIEGGKFVLIGEKVSMHTPANRIAFSPNGATVLVGEVSRRVCFYAALTGEMVEGGGLVHTARVDAVAWSPCGKFAVTGGLDGSLAVWEIGVKGDHRRFKGAHRGGITGVAFAADGTVISTGGDNTIVAWTQNP